MSHISMLQSHADEVKEQYEKHGGAVYTIDELNELIGTDINRDGLKNFHLLKKTFGLRYVGKARTK
ncbi:MAG: hypothetical protein EH225_08940 [Calditrichaeota bacterium]|nr:MAG: hypothetical protein EH225_08940 [Calditrichota bacterium]